MNKQLIIVVMVIVCAVTQGVFSGNDCRIANADLEIFINEENEICGTYTLTFQKEAIIYYHELSSISQLLGHWLEIWFEGEEKKYFLKNYTMVLFPHEDDVKTMKPGDSISFSFVVGEKYWLADEDGAKHHGLPNGSYKVAAQLVIPDNSRVDRRRDPLLPINGMGD